MKVLNNCEIVYLQILNEDGKIVNKKEMPKLSKDELLKMYYFMVLAHVFDEEAILLQRQGRIYTYASLNGQEAAQVGSAYAMKKTDIAFPSFREHGVYLTRGAKPEGIFLYHKGDERGACSKDVNVFTPSIPVGSQIPHAAGAGMAFNYQQKKSAAIGYFGDGSTSKGDFHEAMNFAGVFNAHTVFLCQNNQFAISLQVKEQTKAQTIAQKAIAYGMKGIRVDGNDILAVYKATKDALSDAYKGIPTLVECLTYRMGDHTTSDDATKYRSENEVKAHVKFEPISRFKKYLMSQKILTEANDKKIREQIKKEIETGVKNFEAMKPYPASDIINYLYEKIPEVLIPELEEIKSTGEAK